MKHILITGERGAGKSTLIQRLCSGIDAPLYGFCTKRSAAADAQGSFPVYMHPAWQRENERAHTAANLIGCSGAEPAAYANIFNTLGVELIRSAKSGGIIIMDELGFMENEAEAFKQAVFDALNGSILVIAAVKARYGVELLDNVRAHKNARLYTVTPDNREELYALISAQLHSKFAYKQ